MRLGDEPPLVPRGGPRGFRVIRSWRLSTPPARFSVARLMENWGSLIGVVPSIHHQHGAQWYADGIMRYTQMLCSYPKCCVVANHTVGPDMHCCTSTQCRHLVHLICQGHYADKQRQQSRLEEDEADWRVRCYNCQLTDFQKLLRDSLLRSRADQEKAEEADSKSGKPPAPKRESFFRSTMVAAGRAAVATQKAKSSEMQLSMKRAKLKKSERVRLLLETCWELAVGMNEDGTGRRQSMLIHDYVNWAGGVLTARVDEEELPPDEELVFNLQNDFYMEGVGGEEELPKNKFVDLMVFTASHWIEVSPCWGLPS